MISNNLRWWEFEVESRNYNNSKNSGCRPKFRGKIRFTYNESSLEIYNFYYLFDDFTFSLLATPSWFEKKNHSCLNNRQTFLNDINNNFQVNKKQLRRPSPKHKYNEDDLFTLNKQQLNFLNSNSQKYLSTIKSLDAFITGSNPSGEELNPNNAPIIMSKNQDFFGKNFALFFKYYTINENNYSNDFNFKKFKELKEDYFAKFRELTTKKNSKFKELKKYVEELNKHYDFKTENDKTYIKSLRKQTIANIEKILSLKEINKQVEIERKKVPKTELKEINVFGLSETYRLERAHIFSVADIRALLIKTIKIDNVDLKDEKIENILSFISNPNNLIALDPTTHSKFDNFDFTWNESNGLLCELKDMNDFKSNDYKSFIKIKQIPDNYLNDRKIFLYERNKLLKKNGLHCIQK